MTSFHVKPHHFDVDRTCCEIVGTDGKLLAVIYVVRDLMVRVVSKHISSVELDESEEPPVANIQLGRKR